MRKRSLWNSPRISLSLMLVLLVSLVIAGCGGGGGSSSGGSNSGGGNNSGGGGVTPNTSIVSGRVVDNVGTGNGVNGAKVTIVGTSLSTTTASDGSFQIRNVPLTAKQFVVTTPDVAVYPNIITYLGNYYNTDPGRAGGQCLLPLPTLANGQTVTLPGNVLMYNIAASSNNGGSAPPPPPPSGCF